MSKKATFNRVDKIKDATAKTELARAHAMVALFGLVVIVLLWTLYFSITINVALIITATVLLAFIVIFSTGVVYTMLRTRK